VTPRQADRIREFLAAVACIGIVFGVLALFFYQITEG
jgi:hypothetical protein